MAGLIKIQCPKCKSIHSVADSYLYQKVRCPKCNSNFVAYDDVTPTKPILPSPLSPRLNDDPNIFSILITMLCGIFLVVEIVALVIFIMQLNPPLPDGPYAMALSQKLSIIQSAKIKIAFDLGAIIITLIPLLLACILNVLTKIYRRG